MALLKAEMMQFGQWIMTYRACKYYLKRLGETLKVWACEYYLRGQGGEGTFSQSCQSILTPITDIC